jgi:predicted nucleotidyltransferase
MTPTREEILKILRDNKERFAEKYGVTKLGLFGSFARNEATEESDVDVCFDTARSEPFIATHLKKECEKILQRSVDVVQPHRFMRALFLKRLEQEVIYV